MRDLLQEMAVAFVVTDSAAFLHKFAAWSSISRIWVASTNKWWKWVSRCSYMAKKPNNSL